MPLPKSTYTAEDYWGLPEGVRAELIDGELWDLASPSRKHQEIVSALTTRLNNHISSHGGSCKVSVICDAGKLSDRGCEGAPDMVVEVVSPSNPEMDYVSKLNLYREAGVREYWICDPQRERTLAYSFGSEAVMALYAFDEPVPSSIFPDFSINFSAIVAGM